MLDNLATPLAASLGDLLTLIILGLVANIGANVMASFVSTIIFAILIIFVALMVLVTIRNAYVQELIWAGWIPLLLALGVSRFVEPVIRTITLLADAIVLAVPA